MRTQDTHPGAALALPLPKDLTILTPRCQLRIPSEKKDRKTNCFFISS
jgi:hypothetical protein